MREPHEFEAPSCAEVGGDHWFPERDSSDGTSTFSIGFAKRICGKCPHQTECAEWGIYNEPFGIWGGLTQPAMRLVRRQRRIILGREDVA